MIVGVQKPDIALINPPSDGDKAIARASVIPDPTDATLTEDTIKLLVRHAADEFYNPVSGDFRTYLLAALYVEHCVSPNTTSRGYVAHFPTTLAGDLNLLLLQV